MRDLVGSFTVDAYVPAYGSARRDAGLSLSPGTVARDDPRLYDACRRYYRSVAAACKAADVSLNRRP